MVKDCLDIGISADEGIGAGSTRQQSGIVNGHANKLQTQDRAVHDWYRFVLSFPPHCVRQYLERFRIRRNHCVLDPFCGTGTTLVECKRLGVASSGIETNPMAHFASQVKVDWSPDPAALLAHARRVAELARRRIDQDGLGYGSSLSLHQDQTRGLRALSPERAKLLLANSISPLPLHKTLVLKDCLDELRDDQFYGHELLALARALVQFVGNLKFGPEVGVSRPKADAPVLESWLAGIRGMAQDLEDVRGNQPVPSAAHLGDSREILQQVAPHSIDAVITSPPYPNEKDYTRTTRLESVLLGFICSRSELRELKKGLIRSNTRGVYKDDLDDQWISGHPEVERLADEIEARRIQLGKTSGFERLYARVTKLYFGGMARHLSSLTYVLKPGARLAYVVGDQASYLRVMIRTGSILADIARSLGYEVESVDLFRTRQATATRDQLREEVLVLRWPG